MQRFYYQQLYQKSDPLFRFDPRNVPTEEEEEHSSQSSDSDPKKPDLSPPKSPLRGPVTSLTKKFEQFTAEEEEVSEIPPVPPPIAPNLTHVTSPITNQSRTRNLAEKVKGILKRQGAPKNSKRRVQFDPLALLLDASLEGELDLVKRVIDKVGNYYTFGGTIRLGVPWIRKTLAGISDESWDNRRIQVYNPSSANDEGITALHNSVCAGYFDVVK